MYCTFCLDYAVIPCRFPQLPYFFLFCPSVPNDSITKHVLPPENKIRMSWKFHCHMSRKVSSLFHCHCRRKSDKWREEEHLYLEFYVTRTHWNSQSHVLQFHFSLGVIGKFGSDVRGKSEGKGRKTYELTFWDEWMTLGLGNECENELVLQSPLQYSLLLFWRKLNKSLFKGKGCSRRVHKTRGHRFIDSLTCSTSP